jgi:hypothetical protein
MLKLLSLEHEAAPNANHKLTFSLNYETRSGLTREQIAEQLKVEISLELSKEKYNFLLGAPSE